MIYKRYFILLIILLSAAFLVSDPPNWQQITGAQYSMIVVAEIDFNNQPFTGAGNNLAAAFGPGGETDCRSVGTWSASNQVWYFTIVGNQGGEVIDFRIYDENTDSVYESLNSLLFYDGTTTGSISDPFIILMPTITILDAPENVTITLFLDWGLVILNWTEVADAQSYYVYSGNTPDVDTTPGNHVGRQEGTSWIGAIDGSKKFYVVTASDQPISDEFEKNSSE